NSAKRRKPQTTNYKPKTKNQKPFTMFRFLFVCFFALIYSVVSARDVYPVSWWVGMKDPKLQLMVYEKDIAHRIPMLKITASGIKLADGVTLKKIHRVENPNYV